MDQRKMKKQTKELLVIPFAYLFSFLIMYLSLGWHIFILGKKCVSYYILIEQPIIGLFLSILVANFVLFRREQRSKQE